MDFSTSSNNSQEELKWQSTQMQQKRNRRKKDSITTRDFNCGCGKMYLSYAALYTHVKQKHNGQPPEGTFIPIHGKGRKGRPKNSEFNEDESFNSSELKELSLYECGELDEILYFLKNVGKNLKQELDEAPQIINIDEFPREVFKDIRTYKPIFEELILIATTQNEFQIKQYVPVQKQEEDSLEYVKLNEIFAKFLAIIYEFVTLECFKELSILICIFRYLINKSCYEMIPWYSQEKEFCEEEEMSQYVYYFIDCFEAEFSQTLLTLIDKSSFQLIGPLDQQYQNSVYLLKHFLNWMYFKRYIKNSIIID